MIEVDEYLIEMYRGEDHILLVKDNICEPHTMKIKLDDIDRFCSVLQQMKLSPVDYLE